MMQTFYRLKHKDGKFFTGNQHVKKFTAMGKYYTSEAELKHELSPILSSKKRPCDVKRFMDQVMVVKEIHEVTEEIPQFDLNDFSKAMQEKRRILDSMSGRKHGYHRSILIGDLTEMFPDWQLDGFVHIVYIDGYKMNRAESLNGGKLAIKQLTLKRHQYKVVRNTLAFDDPAMVAMIKLMIADNIVEYHDLSKL